MTMCLYTIHDRLACESGPVFEAKNDSVASRGALQMLKDQNPSEFKLLRLGSIDHDTNLITVLPVPEDVYFLGETIKSLGAINE